jgi:glycerol 2-dehydrogenase (NADP+)
MGVDRSTESGTNKRPGSRWRPCTHQVSYLNTSSSYFQIADPYLLTPIGKVKAIGVSNWSIPYLEDLSKTWKVVPAINQVELHPYNPQHDLKKYCDDKGILLEAYCPLGSTGAPLLKDEQLIKIAEKNKVSVATICISYQVNRGVVVLPKSVTPEREFLRDMFDWVLGFELIQSPDIP